MESYWKVYFKVRVNESLDHVDGFKMFLSDQDTFNSFDVDGASIQSHKSKPGLHYFEVETHIVKKLQNDPRVVCRDYSITESYGEVR